MTTLGKMHGPSLPVRASIGLVGLIMLLVGAATWSLESEYGAGTTHSVEYSVGSIQVYEIDEQNPDAEGHPGKTLVFAGSQQEADAYLEKLARGGRNYVIPALIIGAGAVLLIGALLPTSTFAYWGRRLTRGS